MRVAGLRRTRAYRAPKGRRAEGQYHSFCLDHVKEYNRTYNYFAGMDDNDIAGFQKSAATGIAPRGSSARIPGPEYNGGKLRSSPSGAPRAIRSTCSTRPAKPPNRPSAGW